MTRGARESSFRSLKSVSECLADEIIAASKGSGSGANSYAVKKKDEIERVAKGNR
jgi:small subunit ribosomal protein S5e